MNKLIPTQQNNDGSILVSGRDLHEFLGVGTKYTDWFNRMKEYGLVENVDFVSRNELTQKREGSFKIR